jgi:acyl-CoA synthetase (AMP-forming)/AMP-acid ligase II
MPDLILGSDWVRPVHSAPGYPFGAGTTLLPGILARQAALHPDAPFLTDGVTLTYAQAHAEVTRRAAVLCDWGLQRGDRVGILGPNSVDFALGVLSVLEAGGVGVLLNHNDPPARVTTRAEFAGVRFLLHDPAKLNQEPKSGLRAASPKPTDAALIFFTSGTTGNPKAVVQSHYAVAQNALSLAAHHRIAPGVRLLCVLPLHHVNGLEFTVFGALVGGGHTFLTRGVDPLKFWSMVDDNSIHIISLVPNLLRLLSERPALRRRPGPHLRYSVSAAAPLSTAIAQSALEKLGLRIVQGYGLSEVTNFSCVLPPDLTDAQYERWMLQGKRTSIGPALPGQAVQIRNGELLIRGHCVMSGYLHNEKATEEAFEGDWFHTGDQSYSLPDENGRDFFHISGRVREIAKRSGAMINLLEIDEVLAAIPGVADAAAAAFPNRWVDEEIGAVVVRDATSPLDEASLMAHCRQHLPFAEIPKAIVFVEEVPRTVTGKIRRGELSRNFSGLEDRLFTETRRS